MNFKKLKQSKDFQENLLPPQTSDSKRPTFYESFQKFSTHQKQSSLNQTSGKSARVQKLLISNEKMKAIKCGGSPKINKHSSVLKESKNNNINKTAIIEEDSFLQQTPNIKGLQGSNGKNSSYIGNASPLMKKSTKQSSKQLLQQNFDEYFKESNKMKKKNKSLGNLLEKKKLATTTTNQAKSGQDLSFEQMAQYFNNTSLLNQNSSINNSNNFSSINVKKIDLMSSKTTLCTDSTSCLSSRTKQQQSLNFKKQSEGEGQEFSRYFQNKQYENEDKVYVKSKQDIRKKKVLERLRENKKYKQFKKKCSKENKQLRHENNQLKDQLYIQSQNLSNLQKLYSQSQKANTILKLLLEFNNHLHLQLPNVDFSGYSTSLIPNLNESFILHSNDFQYFPDKILGRGGFGEVYLGKLHGTKDVAIKILRIHVNEEQVKFLQGELMAMIVCEHPNLVKLYGVCIESAKEKCSNNQQINLAVFIVMELLVTDLRKLVFKQQKIQLNKKQKYKILLDILKGLDKLHASNYVHCDLKMQNILLDSKLNAKISDFGLSKRLGQGKTKQTITGGFSERNSAFEYLVEDKVSTKGDIWSFGILMYELMAQRIAWGNLTGPQTVAKVSIQTPFYSYNQKIGDESDSIIENCLNYDHCKRPSALMLIEQVQLLFDSQ